jgi:hypothetical protein
MLFGPRARRCGTSQTLSVGDGLTRKPIGDCCVCIATIMLKVCLGSVVASRVAVSRLGGCRCIWWMLVGLCTIVRGDNNSKVLLMSWYWYAISMNVGAMNVYLGSV